MRLGIFVFLLILLFPFISYSEVKVKDDYRKNGTKNVCESGFNNSATSNQTSYTQNTLPGETSKTGSEYSIKSLIGVFGANERSHELLVNDGYEYSKDDNYWIRDKDIVYFKRYPDGEKQLVYEFFNKSLFEDLKLQLKNSGYIKSSVNVEGRDVYLNDQNVVSLNSYLMNYNDMEVMRYVCTVESAEELMRTIRQAKDQQIVDYKLVSYKGVSFQCRKGWGSDTTANNGSFNIMCGSESDIVIFKVEGANAGANNIDSTKLQSTILKLVESAKAKGGTILDQYRVNFAGYKGYAFNFIQKIRASDNNINGRYVVFANGDYVYILTMLAGNWKTR